MRHQSRQRDAQVDPKLLYCDIALLVTESRLPDSKSGRVEGPHCRQQRVANDALHQCDVDGVPLCAQAGKIRKRTDGLFASGLPLSVQAVLIAEQCAGTNDCLPHGVLLETWTIQLHTRRHASTDTCFVNPSILLQAIRSHLGFSQLSAWLIKHAGALPNVKVAYRVALPGEFDSQQDKATPLPSFETHLFPLCAIDKSRVLAVEVRSHKRLDEVPLVLACVICTAFPALDAGECSNSTSVKSSTTPVPIVSDAGSSSSSSSSSSALWQPERSDPSTSSCDSQSTTVSSPLTPMTPSPSFVEPHDAVASSIPSNATWASNPLFNPDGGGVELLEPPAADGYPQVRFYVSTDDDRFRSTAEERPREGSPPRNNWSRRKRLISQKILISDEKDGVVAAESAEVELLTELLAPKQRHGLSVSAQSPTTTDDDRPSSSQTPRPSSSFAKKNYITKKSVGSEQRKTRNPGRNLFGRHQFHQGTGLPLTSSPAPLKRNQHSFDYDASLGTISGIRSALYNDHDSGSSDSDCGSSHCKSAPASTNLLGNFEESALNGRIKPFGSIDGFLLDLAASGSFCPPHVSLPVTTFFFNVSDDNAPSPYLGHCDLDKIGKKGYHLPKKGTVQATLFNPQGTVVKMFVVRYDLLDMPAGCQTFVRQRTFFMPSNGTLNDARIHRSWLRYLIHLRFATSRSGKLYLHTDIRMLFSRKSELDAYNLETGDTGVAAAAAPMDTFELRSFTEMPKNPKFSPRKCGRRGSSLANERDDNAVSK